MVHLWKIMKNPFICLKCVIFSLHSVMIFWKYPSIPHHFRAFGQYPSSPKLKGAKNFLKKENIEKVPHVFLKFPPLHLEGFLIVTGHKNQPRLNWFAPTNSFGWWNPPYLDHQGTLEERDCHGHILNVDDHRSVPVYFSAGFAGFSAVWRKMSHEKKNKLSIISG